MPVQKTVKVVTPKGIARFPHITKKDTEGKFATKKYTTEIVLTEEETAEMKRFYREIAAELCPDLKKPHLPIKTSKKDGTVSFIFKSKSKPYLMDAKGSRVPMTTTMDVPGGSTIRVAGKLAAWEKGLTAYLDAVQIVKLAWRGHNFEPVNDDDGGFIYSADFETPAVAAKAGAEQPEEDDDDFGL